MGDGIAVGIHHGHPYPLDVKHGEMFGSLGDSLILKGIHQFLVQNRTAFIPHYEYYECLPG